MDTPAAVFPAISPVGVPASLPDATIRSVAIRNFAKADGCGAYRTEVTGNKSVYEEYVRKEFETRFGKGTSHPIGQRTMDSLKPEALARLAAFCCVGHHVSWSGRLDVHKTIHGIEAGRVGGRAFEKVALGGAKQRRRALGYASKICTVVQDVRSGPRVKTLVMVTRAGGHKHVLRSMSAALPRQHVVGYPWAKTAGERADAMLGKLLGGACEQAYMDAQAAEDRDEAKKSARAAGRSDAEAKAAGEDATARASKCHCSLCAFNREGGPQVRAVADPEEMPSPCPPDTRARPTHAGR